MWPGLNVPGCMLFKHCAHPWFRRYNIEGEFESVAQTNVLCRVSAVTPVTKGARAGTTTYTYFSPGARRAAPLC